jgi:hypothetical protein
VDDIGLHYTWLENVSVISPAIARHALFRSMRCRSVVVLQEERRCPLVPRSLWLARCGESRRRQFGVCLPDFTPPINLSPNFTSFFPSRFTPLSTLVSGPPAQRSRNTGLQLPAMMPRRLMAYTNVSGGRPGWPADRQVYTHLLRARPAVIARAATADRTIIPVVPPPGMPALEMWQTHSHEL